MAIIKGIELLKIKGNTLPLYKLSKAILNGHQKEMVRRDCLRMNCRSCIFANNYRCADGNHEEVFKGHIDFAVKQRPAGVEVIKKYRYGYFPRSEYVVMYTIPKYEVSYGPVSPSEEKKTDERLANMGYNITSIEK